MTTRRLLIAAPTLVAVVLLASYFWVPSYEDQTRGNPDRLNQYITASSGDASLLNPVLAAESTSSQIDGLVFEGLVDYDRNLHHRGRIAKDWRIYENAYFVVNAQTPTAQWGKLDADALAARLNSEVTRHASRWPHIKSVSLVPPTHAEQKVTLGQGDHQRRITLRISSPAQIRLTLDRVDQDLFKRLADLLGQRYFDDFRAVNHVSADPPVGDKQLAELADRYLPATVHNPVIEFHLRPGVRFHDGKPLTAEDVRFTYEAIMDPRNLSPRVPDYEPVKSVDVVDPLTARIIYKRLYSPALGTWSMGILPAHLLNAKALRAEALAAGKDPAHFTLRQSSFNQHPIGCGPFVFREWRSDQYIRLARNMDYWEGPPNYHQYALRIIPDPLTQEMEFYAGTIDDYKVQPHQVARLSHDPRFQSFSGLSFGYTYIGYNMRRPPFDDVRVRRALGMAIDCHKIIKYLLYGQGEPISGPFPKQTDYYNQNVPPLPYDPEGALRLLAEAGWTPGTDGYLQKNGRRLAFTLITNNGNPLRKAILAIAQDAWRRIGIQVETDLLEWSVFIQKRVNQHDFDALVLGWSMGIDPDLYQIWHSSQTGPYQLNFVGFKNQRADELIIKIRQEYNHAKKVAYCHQLHKLIAAEQPYTFLYVGRWTAVLDKRIVRKITLDDGRVVYKRITSDKTGNYTFYFNQWIKLAHVPNFEQ